MFKKTTVPESQLQVHACNFIKKDTLALVLSREFCEILKRTRFLQNTSGRVLLTIQVFS